MKNVNNKLKKRIRKNFSINLILTLIVSVILLIVVDLLLFKMFFWFLENNIILFVVVYIYCIIMIDIKMVKKIILKIINPYFLPYLKAVYAYIKYGKVTTLIEELEYQVLITTNQKKKENYKLFVSILHIVKEGVANNNLSKLENIKYDWLSSKNKINYDFWLLIGYLETDNLNLGESIISKYKDIDLKKDAWKVELMKKLIDVHSKKNYKKVEKYFINLLSSINNIIYKMIINHNLANIYISENKYYNASIYLKKNISFGTEFFIAEKSNLLFLKILNIDSDECYKKVVELGNDILGVKLNYNKESFELLDKIINKINGKIMKKEDIAELSYFIGVYYGDLLLKNGFNDDNVRWNIDIDNNIVLSNEQNFKFSPFEVVNEKIVGKLCEVKSLKYIYEKKLSELKKGKEKFNVEIKIDFSEFKKMSRHFYDKFNIIFIVLSILTILTGFYDLVPPDNLPVWEMICTDIVLIILIYLFLKIVYFIILPFKYKKYKKKVFIPGTYDVHFYSNYVEIINDSFYKKIEYESLMGIKEYKDRLYIIINKKSIVPIIKSHCTFEQKKFIKSIS